MVRVMGLLFIAFLINGCATSGTRQGDAAIRQAVTQLSARWDQEPVPVGLEPQVFFDDALIRSRSENLTRHLGRAEKVSVDEPLVKPDYPWEGLANGVFISVIRRDDKTYQMWYDCGSSSFRGTSVGAYNRLGYAESSDGLEWKKPFLVPYMNNIVMQPVIGAGVYYDAREKRGGHRYKAAYGTIRRHGASNVGGLTFAHSRNGKRWSIYDDVVMLDDNRADTHNSLFWDEELGLYRVYTRTLTQGGRSSRLYVRPYVGTSGARVLARALFVPVSAAPWVHVSDTSLMSDMQIYSMSAFKYGPVYVGQIALYDNEFVNYCIAVSRDGSKWDLQYVKPSLAVVQRGESGSFDGGMIFPQCNEPIEKDGQWLLYYGAAEVPRGEIGRTQATRPYTRSIGLAVVRKEGLLYLENENGSASMTTKSFVLQGRALHINADASRGTIRVTASVVHGDGRETEWGASRIITADDTRIRVEWPDGDLSALIGKAIRLRFDMSGAVRLYGMQVSR